MERRVEVAIVATALFAAAGMPLLSFPVATGDQGGPDTYGYEWTDNQGSPPMISYNWVDVRGLGTKTSADETGPHWVTENIGFPFTFYGVSYSQANLSHAGWLSFKQVSSDFHRFSSWPSPIDPDALVSAFAEDYSFGGGQPGVYVARDLTANPKWFGVEWYRAAFQSPGCGVGNEQTFQALLYSNGVVKIQYQTINTICTPRKGIENEDGFIGLEYTRTAAAGVAVQFAVDKVDIGPDQNRFILAGTTQDYTLTVKNLRPVDERINLQQTNTYAWTVEFRDAGLNLLTDTNSPPDGIPDTDLMAAGQFLDVVARVYVPSGAQGLWDNATVYANSTLGAPAKSDTAILSTRVDTPDVGVEAVTAPSVVQAGSTVTVNATIRNYGLATLTFQARCDATGPSPTGCGPPNPRTITNLPGGGTTYLNWLVGTSALGTYAATVTTLLAADTVPVNNASSTVFRAMDFIFFDDVDSPGGATKLGQWTGGVDSNGTRWEYGVPTNVGPPSAHSGTEAWGTNISSNYANNAFDLGLVSPVIDLSLAANASLVFYHWYNTELAVDGGTVLIRNLTGPKQGWTLVTPTTDYPTPAISSLFVPNVGWDLPGYSGSNGGWQLQEFSLDGFVENQIQFRFTFASDTSQTFPGWYIDDVGVAMIPRVGIMVTPDDIMFADVGEVLTYNVMARNLQPIGDIVDLMIASAPVGWATTLLQAGCAAPLTTDANMNGVPDTGMMAPNGSFAFCVRVLVPSLPPIGSIETATVTGISSNDPAVRDTARLITKVYPHLEVSKWAVPDTIYQRSAPPGFVPKQSNVTVRVEGLGVPLSRFLPQDTVFIEDSSGSMNTNDPSNIRINAVKQYIDRMAVPDRASVMHFTSFPQMVSSNLTMMNASGKALLRGHADSIACSPGCAGATNILDSIQMANDWLRARSFNNAFWGWNHTRVEILLTDGVCTAGPVCSNTSAAAIAILDDAISQDIRIFTVGLCGDPFCSGVDENFLRWVAWYTGARYYQAQTPEDLLRVYLEIGTLVEDRAGRPYPSGTVPLVEDVVPGEFDVLLGTVSPPYDNTYVDAQSRRHLLWNVSQVIRLGDVRDFTYRVDSDIVGIHDTTEVSLASVNYLNWNDTGVILPIPSAFVNVLPGTELQPPRNVETVVNPGSDDVEIRWQFPSDMSGVDYYEVYGGATQTTMNLNVPNFIVRTFDNGTLSRLDMGRLAATGEYYYVVRSVNGTFGMRSVTSNTAGVFRVMWAAGSHAISLPLEPAGGLAVTTFASATATTSVRTLDAAGNWATAFGTMAVGVAYLINLSSAVTYTFTGRPAAHILFKEGFGFSGPQRTGLSTVAAGNDVQLSWPTVPSVTGYEVRAAASRMGLFSPGGFLTFTVAGTAYTHVGAAWCPSSPCTAEVYYLILPYVQSGPTRFYGAGLYGAGVITYRWQGHASFGLPVKPAAVASLDAHVAQIGALGIMYFQGQAWVPHFAEMPAGVYDPSVVQAVGYQITVVPGTAARFVGR